MFLHQCNNQKNYSFVCYNIEEKEIKCNWVFHFWIFEIWWGISEMVIKLIFLVYFLLWVKELRTMKRGTCVAHGVTKRNQKMRNGVDYQRDPQYNLALLIESVICFIFLKYLLDRGFPKLYQFEFFAERNQWLQQQNIWSFRKDSISIPKNLSVSTF